MSAPPPQVPLHTADLHGLGVTRGELSGPRWRSPFYGIHSPAVGDTEDSCQRILDAAELVPQGGAIGGWAAAHVLGATELDGRGRSGRQREEVVIVLPPRHHQVARDGIRFVRSRLDDGDITEVEGIRVTTPVRTAFDLARASTVEEGLVGTDVICRQLGIAPASVVGYLERHPRFRGVPVARLVLPMTDPRSRSTGESRLRFVWVVLAGLPRPQCNAYVVNELGEVVAMPDLLDDLVGLIGEYDGATHRALADHTHDNAREEDLEQLGLVFVRATVLDVGSFRSRTVARLLAGRRRAEAQVARSWGWRPSPIPVRAATASPTRLPSEW